MSSIRSLWLCVALLSACATISGPSERLVSRDFDVGEVADYALFPWSIPGHALAIVQLKSGAQMPVVCRVQGSRAYPIPQSVFERADGLGFRIECAPFTPEGHDMREISVRIDADGPRAAEGEPTPAPLSPRPAFIAMPVV